MKPSLFLLSVFIIISLAVQAQETEETQDFNSWLFVHAGLSKIYDKDKGGHDESFEILAPSFDAEMLFRITPEYAFSIALGTINFAYDPEEFAKYLDRDQGFVRLVPERKRSWRLNTYISAGPDVTIPLKRNGLITFKAHAGMAWLAKADFKATDIHDEYEPKATYSLTTENEKPGFLYEFALSRVWQSPNKTLLRLGVSYLGAKSLVSEKTKLHYGSTSYVGLKESVAGFRLFFGVGLAGYK